MSGFKRGQIVNITITGAVIDHEGGPGWLCFFIDGTPHQIMTAKDEVTVTSVGPPGWPPEHNDTWSDGTGCNWVAGAESETDEIALYSVLGRMSAREFLDENPKMYLVHREPGPDDEDNPTTWTGPDGQVWDLTIDYQDDEGFYWHWAGGFGSGPNSSLMWPLMSSTQRSLHDKPLFACPELHPKASEKGEVHAWPI